MPQQRHRTTPSQFDAGREPLGPQYQLSQESAQFTSHERAPSQVGLDMAEDALDFSTELRTELQTQYFRHLYPLPSFNFLHEPTISRRRTDGTLNEPLQLALCAMTALMLGNNLVPCSRWIDRAEIIVFGALHRPSMFHLQALLLIIRYQAAVGNFARAFMLAGLASRAAAGLRLHYEYAEIGPLAQEMRRRTFWSLYLLDDIFCVGLSEYELSRADTIHLKLPDEENLQSDSSKAAYLDCAHSIEPETLDSQAAILRLAAMRRSIMKLTRRVLAKECGSRELWKQVNHQQTALQRLQSQLRDEDRYPPRTLHTFQWHPRYLMLHTSWHQCHCDLYRLFVSGYTEASPLPVLEDVTTANHVALREKCLKHAESIAQLLGEFYRQNTHIVILELDTAVCAYHSARLILFGICSLKKDETDSLDKQRAIGMARLCLDLIDRYYATNMCSRPMRDDLARLINHYSAALTDGPGFTSQPEEPMPLRSSQVSTAANARQKLSVHSLLLQSEFVDDSRETVLTGAESSANSYDTGNTWLQSSSHTLDANAFAVDPLFDNLDPFSISYWDGFSSDNLDSRAFGMAAADDDAAFDGMYGVL